jgi:hypothetical protein
MSESAAFYQILFQNDTLFQLGEQVEKPMAEPTHVEIPALITPAIPLNTVSAAPVLANNPATPNIKHPEVKFPALAHQILILTDDPKNRDLVESEALLLRNILKAVGHTPENTDILNFSFLPGADARTVLSEKRTHYFITFGVPLIKLQLDLLLVPFTPKYDEGIWFLLAEPLAVIDADKALKKKLWLALQKMFEKV